MFLTQTNVMYSMSQSWHTVMCLYTMNEYVLFYFNGFIFSI